MFRPQTIDWWLETGDWWLETGDWRLVTGDWRLETVLTLPLFLGIRPIMAENH